VLVYFKINIKVHVQQNHRESLVYSSKSVPFLSYTAPANEINTIILLLTVKL